MYAMITAIPVVTILLSLLYILNDRIAKSNETHTDRRIMHHNRSTCNARKCTTSGLIFI